MKAYILIFINDFRIISSRYRWFWKSWDRRDIV